MHDEYIFKHISTRWNFQKFLNVLEIKPHGDILESDAPKDLNNLLFGVYSKKCCWFPHHVWKWFFNRSIKENYKF